MCFTVQKKRIDFSYWSSDFSFPRDNSIILRDKPLRMCVQEVLACTNHKVKFVCDSLNVSEKIIYSLNDSCWVVMSTFFFRRRLLLQVGQRIRQREEGEERHTHHCHPRIHLRLHTGEEGEHRIRLRTRGREENSKHHVLHPQCNREKRALRAERPEEREENAPATTSLI